MRISAALPAAPNDDVTANREFDGLCLRFVSSVAEADRAATAPSWLAAGDAPASQGQAHAEPYETASSDARSADLSRGASPYIGETEKHMGAVLGGAAGAGATLLLDEADALLGRRTEVHESNDRAADVPPDAGGASDPVMRLRAMAAIPWPPR